MDPSLENKKVLLALLPYWTPLIPPLGISCLKSYLQNEGYEVTAIDANMEKAFRDIYHQYFAVVKQCVPKYKQGNFFNIGMEFMRNHMMAHLNYEDERQYVALLKIVFYKSYYCEASEAAIGQLIALIDSFYGHLREYVLEQLERVRPDVLGLSTFSGTLPASLFAFRLAKEKYPHVATVMGGGTFAMELAIDNPNFERLLARAPYIDKFIVGEGEALFLKYLKGRLPPEQRVYTQADLTKEEHLDVNKASFPDFSNLHYTNYPQLASWSSRSCPYQCSFCSETIHWGVYRKKTPARIAAELKELYQKYGTRLFLFGDSLLNIVIDGLATELMQENVQVYWDGYLRTDPPVCKPENALRWREAGFYRARLGVESGSQAILDVMNKKTTVNNIRDSVRALAAAGIKTTTYWIVGPPGETEADFQMTLDLIEELSDDLWEAEVNPFSYFLTGQVHSDKWMSQYKRVTLYPEEYTQMLLTQTWILEGCQPEREVIYERVNRFVDHCYKLGIPNPYFEHEIHAADSRWQRLHQNAVPPLAELRAGGNADKFHSHKMLQSLSVDDLEVLLNATK
jgi:radical SAM superfamily enzyme YgiQ (UPF0313 family)